MIPKTILVFSVHYFRSSYAA